MSADIDQNKQIAFDQKMTDILNYGALNLAMAIGYRHGLFDAMDRLGQPADVKTIAGDAGLNHRYVREWLGVMSTGRIVETRAGKLGETQYFLPKSHADVLTRRAGNQNLGVYTQEIPLLTQSAMEQVMDGFISGAGVDFSAYPKFQSFMSELSNAKHRQVLVDQFLPEVDQGRLVEHLKRGIRVSDLGCGEGVAMNLMAQRFPQSEFTGIDTHEPAIATARSQASKMGLANARYVIEDAADIKGKPEFMSQYDYICAFDAIHDQTRPLDALKSVRYMLAPGGQFSMVDIDAASDHIGNLDHPMGPFLYTVSLMHCLPVGLADGGAGLGMMWGREKAVAMLGEAGFQKVEVLQMDHDPFNLHYRCRK